MKLRAPSRLGDKMAKSVIELRLKIRRLSLAEVDEHLDYASREDGRSAPAIGLFSWRGASSLDTPQWLSIVLCGCVLQ